MCTGQGDDEMEMEAVGQERKRVLSRLGWSKHLVKRVKSVDLTHLSYRITLVFESIQ